MLKIVEKKFVYFGHHRIENAVKDRSALYQEFREHMKEELTTVKIVFPEWDLIAHVKVVDNTVVFSVNSLYNKVDIVIDPQ